MDKKETIRTQIWREEAEPDNPFAAAACFCHGYDVFGDVVGKATWIEYLFLLFKGERPSRSQAKTLEDLAVSLANPGPRDNSVHAAMSGGVGGSNNAACLMAALAVGAGQLGGGREVALSMQMWTKCSTDIPSWESSIRHSPYEERADVWPPMEHTPGFNPHSASCPTPLRLLLNHLADQSPGPSLCWLRDNREHIETIAGAPLAITGITAATFHDLGFTPAEGEMLFLLLRLPGAAAHALEQRSIGFRNFPFFHNSIHLENDPEVDQLNL